MPLSSLLEISLVLLSVLYSVVVLSLILGLFRLGQTRSQETPFVSIIVAARNEEKNIGRLLHQLVTQAYPSFEIIIVNDRSTDETGEIISSFAAGNPSITRLDITALDDEMPAKKKALATGISHSRGEILCFTDADCLPRSEWIAELVSLFTPSVGVVAGYSPYDESLMMNDSPKPGILQTVLHKFIAYEELKGAAWSAGSIALGKAWLCTGRNLAYRRIVYDQVGGFERIKHSISGDDDLFLQLVRRETEWNIRYATTPESFVQTAPPPSFGEFVRQRIRHFSAGKYFDPRMKIFFFLFHLANLSLFAAGLAFFLSSATFPIGLLVFGIKIVVDVGLFLTAARIFHAWQFSASFLLMEILYIFYNTLIGPLGFFSRIEWKPESK